MYRIELAPGEVTVFRTLEELATGVRNGVITSRARIYHTASQKWLPIEFHPHYKQALEISATQTIEVPVPPPVERPRPSRRAMLTTTAPTSGRWLDGRPPSRHARNPADLCGLAGARPKISYPEITPAEELVVEEPARAPRSFRPLQLAVAAVVLAAGAYGMMSAFGPSRGHAAPASAPAVADRPALPKVESQAATPAAATPAAATPAAAPTGTPVAVPQPATSGFAPALEPRAIVSSPSRVAADKPSGTTAASVDSSIAPAPVKVDLAVPSLPGADSLVAAPRQRGDSGAIKRILRAVSGGKDVGKPR
jgi:hypothetical protein